MSDSTWQGGYLAVYEGGEPGVTPTLDMFQQAGVPRSGVVC